jgi:uncharacterized membrane protein
MAYYDALIAAWNSATQPPTGVTGTPLAVGMSTRQKLAAVNDWRVAGPAQRVILTPSQILNAIVFDDLAALTQLQISQLTLLLAGNAVDASVGTPIRLGIQKLFTGKAQTLSNLGALVAPFDSSIVSWCAANGYPGGGINLNDVTAAGLS